MAFENFNEFLSRAAMQATELLDAFDSPPQFDLWNNPVLEQAQELDTLAPNGARSLIADEIFRNCNAGNLCDDGHELVDAGINKNNRLWLIYKFFSLTDFNGRGNYTNIWGLITVMRTDQFQSELFFGFDWKRNESLSRLLFDEREDILRNTVLQMPAWRARHRRRHRAG